MVYFLIPILGAGGLSIGGYICARTFNASCNLTARSLHGYGRNETPYPWPPYSLSDGASRHPGRAEQRKQPPTNSTFPGKVLGVAAFLLIFRTGRATLFKRLAGMEMAGAPARGEKVASFGHMFYQMAPPAGAFAANALVASAVSGLLPPAVDGSDGVPRGAAS